MGFVFFNNLGAGVVVVIPDTKRNLLACREEPSSSSYLNSLWCLTHQPFYLQTHSPSTPSLFLILGTTSFFSSDISYLSHIRMFSSMSCAPFQSPVHLQVLTSKLLFPNHLRFDPETSQISTIFLSLALFCVLTCRRAVYISGWSFQSLQVLQFHLRSNILILLVEEKILGFEP